MESPRNSGFATSWKTLSVLAAGVAVFFAVAHAQNSKRGGEPFETFKAQQFDHSTEITNKWMPMKQGTRWIYEGSTIEEDGKVVPHRIEIAATDLVKSIGGVRAVVTYGVDYTDNELVEAELAFYAQDNSGNVWLLGEYPEEYEDGKLTKAPAWIHGLQAAKAGIMMQAEPRLEMPSYSEGWAPAAGWTDRGMTYQMGQQVSVPAGTFNDVLVVKESARSEPDAEQLKYYAPGVGNVRVGWIGTKKVKEGLELIKVEQLDPQMIADIRARALNLEQSAYKHTKNVYAHTSPAIYVQRHKQGM